MRASALTGGIYIDSHRDDPGDHRWRDRQRNVPDRFAIDFSLCHVLRDLRRGVPPTPSFLAHSSEYTEYDLRDLLHEKDRLGSGWRRCLCHRPPMVRGRPGRVTAANRPEQGR